MTERLPLTGGTPFVLLDDATGAGSSRLYRNPRQALVAHHLPDVPDALAQARHHLSEGRHVAGVISYAAGGAFEPRMRSRVRAGRPLVWLGVFDAVETVQNTSCILPPPGHGRVGLLKPTISRDAYVERVERALALIGRGDIYQVNLSFPSTVEIRASPLEVYSDLRAGYQGAWGGVVYDGRNWLLSCSPELFFTLRDGVLIAKPMKGTALRHDDSESDELSAARLRSDPKERAENLMIVDLLRNDLTRVAQPGTVKVSSLFEVEHFPTVHQMTSTVSAGLRTGMDAIDVIKAAFPCGSVTGAPKIRAMEIIEALEDHDRGPYTGSIGFISPNGDAAFNVIIRSLEVKDGAATARLCLGSGIVSDSEPDAEWRECLAKARFLTTAGHLASERVGLGSTG